MSRKRENIEDRWLKTVGQKLIPQLNHCLKNAQLYDSTHSIYQEGIQAFLELFREVTRSENYLNLQIVREYLFINEIRLKISVGAYHIYQSFLNYLTDRRIGSITFDQHVNRSELEQFFKVVATSETGREDSFARVQAQLEQNNIEKITIGEWKQMEAAFDPEMVNVSLDSRELAKATYFKALEVVKEIYQQVRQNNNLDIRKVKHIVHAIVDSIMDGEYTLLALTQIKKYPHFIINHPVNVTIFSVAMGNEMGLTKKQLGELGFCALLHDIGMVKLPKHIIKKIGKRMNLEEQKVLSRHTIYGAQALLRTKKTSDVLIRSVLVCFQHEVGDFYSKIVHKERVDLFSKIVCLASSFNYMTTPHEGVPAMKPEVALNTLLEESGEFSDPILIKVFINTIGKYPVGSMVKLNTGEVAVVLKPNPIPKYLERPVIKLISDASGAPMDDVVVDLMDKDGSGNFKRTIVELIDTTDFELEVTDYITVM